jgi:two-component system sensor histidine kinase PilS (NtrC family)
MQSGVFAITALGSGVIAERLRRAGAAQAELREALVQVRLQAEDVLRALESGIVTVDRTGTLLYANPAASRLLGIDLAVRIGRPVLDLIRERAPVIADALARTAAEGIRTLRADGEIVRDGVSAPVGLTTTAVGDPTGAGERSATAIFQDLTDMRRAEQLSRAAQRLEAITELAASLAHEIRNPLAAIRSAVEQLASRAAAGEDERALSRLIVRESDRLSRLLGEFLDFARVREAKLAPTDVAALVRHVADLARSHPEHGESVEVRTTGTDAPFLADVDDDLLMRALLNLALNALQVMPDRGTLTIGLAEADGRDLPPMARALRPPVVRLTVEDTGPGIAAEVRDRLFQPFITTRPGGHGLGLPMVHRAVEAHQGIVTVESAPGRTCFTLCLPRRAGAA